MRFLAFVVLIFGLAFGNISVAVASTKTGNWQLVKNKDGIKIFTRAVKGSDYKAFRGVVKIQASFDNLLAIMADTRTNCQWMHQCGKPTVLRQVSFTERYIYQVNYLPAPLWNRDIIMHSIARANKRGDVVTIDLKAVPNYCDYRKLRACRKLSQRKAGERYVRIKQARGYFKLRKLSNALVEVTWQMHADPGGELYGWMANLNLVEIPFSTLKGLKNFVKKRKHKRTRLLFAQRP